MTSISTQPHYTANPWGGTRYAREAERSFKSWEVFPPTIVFNICQGSVNYTQTQYIVYYTPPCSILNQESILNEDSSYRFCVWNGRICKLRNYNAALKFLENFGMYSAWNKDLNEQEHETPPVFARIGNKHLFFRDLGHWTFTHTLKPPKGASSGSLFMFARFFAWDQVT